MELLQLLNGITVIKSNVSYKEEISYIANDHRKIKKNSVFVAITGSHRDGNDYIEEAIKKGAVAVVTDNLTKCKMSVPYILVKNVRKAVALMWSNYYGNPAKSIKTVAITGTNGKTSSAYFLYNILRKANINCGLISTIECLINDKKINTDGGGSVSDISSSMTTPDPETLYYLYSLMKEKGVEIAVIEASSHALSQERLEALEIEIGVFTNLSPEHLDFHSNMEEYFEAKKKLFFKSNKKVFNIDDEYGKVLKNGFKNAFGYSIKEKTGFYATEIKCLGDGCEYFANYKKERIRIKSKAIGEFTVYNTLSAVACAKLLGIENTAIQEGIMSATNIKGRLEKYKDKSIYIDYAHTPDAMENVIKTIKKAEPNKTVVVMFGCGGDRDKGKRSEMGRISTTLADITVITSDNCRTEPLNNILSDILKGIEFGKKYFVIPNRKEAIEFIAKIYDNNKVVLLLGKGHEEYEIIGNEKKRFSEKEILDEVFMIDK